MNTITITATYQDGVLKPLANLNLPENTAVSIILTPLPSKLNSIEKQTPFASLRGLWSNKKFPESFESLIQQTRSRSAEKLNRIVNELKNG
ncbi:MAG: antitoxin family protein [Chloroflexi bacterium]|nr:antitoxin family protein [Chloroflexota bacterium]MBI5080519.1 antitoxin family protein [Chloroflexota bacterium]MBI5350578.1 antitoxin family protein [Chloroflexota bacterium]